MSIELIGERLYYDALREADGAWLLMGNSSLYLVSESEGYTLPTWISQKDAEDFALDVQNKKLSPVFFPLTSLSNTILSEARNNIVAVAASPKQGFPALTYSKEEFLELFNT